MQLLHLLLHGSETIKPENPNQHTRFNNKIQTHIHNPQMPAFDAYLITVPDSKTAQQRPVINKLLIIVGQAEVSPDMTPARRTRFFNLKTQQHKQFLRQKNKMQCRWEE